MVRRLIISLLFVAGCGIQNIQKPPVEDVDLGRAKSYLMLNGVTGEVSVSSYYEWSKAEYIFETKDYYCLLKVDGLNDYGFLNDTIIKNSFINYVDLVDK
jgi:hypothetical protein